MQQKWEILLTVYVKHSEYKKIMLGQKNELHQLSSSKNKWISKNIYKFSDIFGSFNSSDCIHDILTYISFTRKRSLAINEIGKTCYNEFMRGNLEGDMSMRDTMKKEELSKLVWNTTENRIINKRFVWNTTENRIANKR